MLYKQESAFVTTKVVNRPELVMGIAPMLDDKGKPVIKSGKPVLQQWADGTPVIHIHNKATQKRWGVDMGINEDGDLKVTDLIRLFGVGFFVSYDTKCKFAKEGIDTALLDKFVYQVGTPAEQAAAKIAWDLAKSKALSKSDKPKKEQISAASADLIAQWLS
jgi:hypothetical protein